MVNKFVDSATTVIDRQAPANSRIPKEGNQISRNRIITLSRLIKNPAFNIIVSSKATPDKMVVIQGMNKINLMFLKENIRVEGIKVNRAKVIKAIRANRVKAIRANRVKAIRANRVKVRVKVEITITKIKATMTYLSPYAEIFISVNPANTKIAKKSISSYSTRPTK